MIFGLRASGFELRAMSYKLRATSHKIPITSCYFAPFMKKYSLLLLSRLSYSVDIGVLFKGSFLLIYRSPLRCCISLKGSNHS